MKATASHPQDWRFLMALFSLSSFLELTAWGHMLAFTPLYLKNDLGVSPDDVPRWVGILASSSLLIAVPLSPIWGALADRYSRKAVILRSQLMEVVAFALLALCTDVWQMLAVRLLLGFSFGNFAVVVATQSMVTPERRVGTAVGIILMSATVAQSVGPLLGSLIINTLGIRAMFAMDAVLTLGAALLIALVFREPAVHDRTTPVWSKVKMVFRQVATDPPVRWNFLCWLLIYGGVAAMDPFLPVLIDRLSEGANAATLTGGLLAGYGVLTALGTPVAGKISDRVGPAPLFLVVALLLALISGGIGVVASLPLLGLLMLVRAGPQAGTSVVLYAHLAAHVQPQHRSAVMSLTPLPRNVAWLLAPVLASVVAGFGLSGAFWMAAAFYGGATLVAILMVRASKPAATL